jgi:fused signal recognition particle receptor
VSETKTKKRGLFGKLFGGAKPAPQLPPQEPAQERPPAPAEAELQPVERPELPATSESEAPVEPQGEEGAPAQTEPEAKPEPQSGTAPGPESRPAIPEQAAIELPAAESPVPKRSWFERLKLGLSRTSSRLGQGITGLFTKRKLDDETIEDLEDLLIQADLGVDTSARIVETLKKTRYNKDITPEEVRDALAAEVERTLAPVAAPLVLDAARKPHVILVVGVNGVGKTTTIGKMARRFALEGKRVMLAAGDTFRAAAIDQLKIWGERTGATVIARHPGADAAGLAFDALREAREQECDALIIDTAGRLQNKAHLMAELEKIARVLKKIDPEAPHSVILALDATTGQNALNQVEIFSHKCGVTGVVMNKLDGTARGGILVAIAARHQLPVHAIGVGEGADDMQPFDAAEFARAIAGS